MQKCIQSFYAIVIYMYMPLNNIIQAYEFCQKKMLNSFWEGNVYGVSGGAGGGDRSCRSAVRWMMDMSPDWHRRYEKTGLHPPSRGQRDQRQITIWHRWRVKQGVHDLRVHIKNRSNTIWRELNRRQSRLLRPCHIDSNRTTIGDPAGSSAAAAPIDVDTATSVQLLGGGGGRATSRQRRTILSCRLISWQPGRSRCRTRGWHGRLREWQRHLQGSASAGPETTGQQQAPSGTERRRSGPRVKARASAKTLAVDVTVAVARAIFRPEGHGPTCDVQVRVVSEQAGEVTLESLHVAQMVGGEERWSLRDCFKRLRAGNGDWSGMEGQRPGSLIHSDPRTLTAVYFSPPPVPTLHKLGLRRKIKTAGGPLMNICTSL